MGYNLSEILLSRSILDNRLAILGPGKEPVTYGRLRSYATDIVGQLNSLGYGINDRIVVVMPNGLEMAVAFLSIAAGFTFVPLNPAFVEDEYNKYLKLIQPKAVLTMANDNSPVKVAANSQKINLLCFSIVESDSGVRYIISGDKGDFKARTGFADSDDIGLILHTSGTTSQPKMVPLTQNNICNSARCIGSSMHLSPADRCLNISPLFHTKGLCGALLTAISSGGSIVCTDGFDPQKFNSWLNDFKPTWYTAASSLHKAILDTLAEEGRIESTLRFIRSSAMPIAQQTLDGLEKLFGVPVLVSYGMTESAAISANPFTLRKTGSSGVPLGTEIIILDDSGNPLPNGMTGEIAIRGPNVMGGYLNAPDVNKTVFINGWLKTGDLGHIDTDGYVFVTGRVKEIINQGGEKISPLEVEQILVSHPGVKDAVVFPLKNDKLGELVSAAVVLKETFSLSESDLRSFVSERLAFYKVPSHIFFLNSIPKSATGKVQRIGFAERNGLTLTAKQQYQHSPDCVSLNKNEMLLKKIWEEAFGISNIGRDENFFDTGGYSIIAAQIFARIESTFHIRLPLDTILSYSTISELAKILEKNNQNLLPQTIIPLQPNGSKAPLFCVHTIGASLLKYEALAKAMGVDRPIYGILPRGLNRDEKPLDRIEDMASLYITWIKEIQPHGPYNLLGFSSAGTIAYEMARQLISGGDPVSFVGLLDHPVPNRNKGQGKNSVIMKVKHTIIVALRFYYRLFIMRSVKKSVTLNNYRIGIITSIMREIFTIRNKPIPDKYAYQSWVLQLPAPEQNVSLRFFDAIKKYTPGTFDGKVILFLAQETDKEFHWLRRFQNYDQTLGWRTLAKNGVEVVFTPGDHFTILLEPNLQVLVEAVKNCLDHNDPHGS